MSGASFYRTGTPFSVVRTNDIAGVGDGNFGQPYNLVGDRRATPTAISRPARERPELLVQSGGVRRADSGHLRQRAAEPELLA
jgi:hypothetical protein